MHDSIVWKKCTMFYKNNELKAIVQSISYNSVFDSTLSKKLISRIGASSRHTTGNSTGTLCSIYKLQVNISFFLGHMICFWRLVLNI
jgi:hypothetical protein